MKTRHGFVSNSSSSSFVIITAGETTILEDGDTEMECCGGANLDINVVIDQLLEARAAGATTVDISHGGGYYG